MLMEARKEAFLSFLSRLNQEGQTGLKEVRE